MSLREPLKLIVRKDLLDDSNAAKDLMDDVKKRLKILLRPGESEKRPELIWPKSMNKEPVEVLRVSPLIVSIYKEENQFCTGGCRVAQRFQSHYGSEFRHSRDREDSGAMVSHVENALDRLTSTLSRCCGDEPWLFRERWEKLFEDFCDVKPEKFDPSRVSTSSGRPWCQ
jgi:inositol hexakisphosphate/diphosphoinositol-pentakisphosphate kinase